MFRKTTPFDLQLPHLIATNLSGVKTWFTCLSEFQCGKQTRGLKFCDFACNP